MLYGFTRDIKREFAVNEPFYETETIGKQIFAAVCNKHAVGVEFKTFFVVLAVIVVRHGGRYIQQSLIRYRAFGRRMNIA